MLARFICSLQSRLVLALPLCSWYSELSVALSILRKVADDPVAAADWLVSVQSALSAGQRLPCSLTLIVTHLIITGQEDVCQLALKTSQAIAAADPCQVGNPHVSCQHTEHSSQVKALLSGLYKVS